MTRYYVYDERDEKIFLWDKATAQRTEENAKSAVKRHFTMNKPEPFVWPSSVKDTSQSLHTHKKLGIKFANKPLIIDEREPPSTPPQRETVAPVRSALKVKLFIDPVALPNLTWLMHSDRVQRSRIRLLSIQSR